MTKFIEVGTIVVPVAEITTVELEPTVCNKEIMQIIVRHGGSAQRVEFSSETKASICYNNIKLAMQKNGEEIHNCN